MRALWLRILDWLSRRFGAGRMPVPREPVSIRPIGVVRNDVKTPRPHGWEDVRSTIVVREDLAPGLESIEDFSHLIVVFSFDRVPDSEQRLRIEGEPAGAPPRGVLATRSQRRPSPIGVSVVRLQRRRGNVLWVAGLDAIHGTPVLDIKPYYPGHDAVSDARLPDWARSEESR